MRRRQRRGYWSVCAGWRERGWGELKLGLEWNELQLAACFGGMGGDRLDSQTDSGVRDEPSSQAG